MKANEFRIGNLVYYRNERICKVSNLGNRFETTFNGYLYGSDCIDEYNPIPITDEILLKSGFWKVSAETIFDYPTYWFSDSEYLFEADGKFYHNLVNADENEIKGIHNLQNIILDLTGKEWKINL